MLCDTCAAKIKISNRRIAKIKVFLDGKIAESVEPFFEDYLETMKQLSEKYNIPKAIDNPRGYEGGYIEAVNAGTFQHMYCLERWPKQTREQA